jgi:ATP-dependent Clp protease ATP-binding subunit ClpC
MLRIKRVIELLLFFVGIVGIVRLIDALVRIRDREMKDRDRFDKFTERARKALHLAQEEAQRLQHNYIGTEHLLLGLIHEGDGVAAKVLSSLGVELDQARSSVESIIGRGNRVVLGEIGLTPRAKKVIELAVDEARRLHHRYIGTEHLLLGLVREGHGIAAGVLDSLGVSLENVRTQTLIVLNKLERSEYEDGDNP